MLKLGRVQRTITIYKTKLNVCIFVFKNLANKNVKLDPDFIYQIFKSDELRGEWNGVQCRTRGNVTHIKYKYF